MTRAVAVAVLAAGLLASSAGAVKFRHGDYLTGSFPVGDWQYDVALARLWFDTAVRANVKCGLGQREVTTETGVADRCCPTGYDGTTDLEVVSTDPLIKKYYCTRAGVRDADVESTAQVAHIRNLADMSPSEMLEKPSVARLVAEPFCEGFDVDAFRVAVAEPADMLYLAQALPSVLVDPLGAFVRMKGVQAARDAFQEPRIHSDIQTWADRPLGDADTDVLVLAFPAKAVNMVTGEEKELGAPLRLWQQGKCGVSLPGVRNPHNASAPVLGPKPGQLKARAPTCDLTKLRAVAEELRDVQTALQTAAARVVSDFDDRWKAQEVLSRDAILLCDHVADTLLNTRRVEVNRVTTECKATVGTTEYTQDPCCNADLRMCCTPRSLPVLLDVVEGINGNFSNTECSAYGDDMRLTLEYAMALREARDMVGRSGRGCRYGESQLASAVAADRVLLDTVLGWVWEQGDDCVRHSDCESGICRDLKCEVLLNSTETTARAFARMADKHLSKEAMRWLRLDLGLSASANSEALGDALALGGSEFTCEGPDSALTHSPKCAPLAEGVNVPVSGACDLQSGDAAACVAADLSKCNAVDALHTDEAKCEADAHGNGGYFCGRCASDGNCDEVNRRFQCRRGVSADETDCGNIGGTWYTPTTDCELDLDHSMCDGVCTRELDPVHPNWCAARVESAEECTGVRARHLGKLQFISAAYVASVQNGHDDAIRQHHLNIPGGYCIVHSVVPEQNSPITVAASAAECSVVNTWFNGSLEFSWGRDVSKVHRQACYETFCYDAGEPLTNQGVDVTIPPTHDTGEIDSIITPLEAVGGTVYATDTASLWGDDGTDPQDPTGLPSATECNNDGGNTYAPSKGTLEWSTTCLWHVDEAWCTELAAGTIVPEAEWDAVASKCRRNPNKVWCDNLGLDADKGLPMWLPIDGATSDPYFKCKYGATAAWCAGKSTTGAVTHFNETGDSLCRSVYSSEGCGQLIGDIGGATAASDIAVAFRSDILGGDGRCTVVGKTTVSAATTRTLCGVAGTKLLETLDPAPTSPSIQGSAKRWKPWYGVWPVRGIANTEEACHAGVCDADELVTDAGRCAARGVCDSSCTKCVNDGGASGVCVRVDLPEERQIDGVEPDKICENAGDDFTWVAVDTTTDAYRGVCKVVAYDTEATCVGAGHHWHSCGLVSADQCGNSTYAGALTCKLSFGAECQSKRECEASGTCDLIPSALATFDSKYYCFKPFATGSILCPSYVDGVTSRVFYEFAAGCYSVDDGFVKGAETDKCIDAGGEWKEVPRSREACEELKRCCTDEHKCEYGLTSTFSDMNAAECGQCDGSLKSVYEWKPGVWKAGSMKAMSWKALHWGPRNAWKRSLTQRKAKELVSRAHELLLGEAEAAGAGCEADLLLSNMERLARACSGGKHDVRAALTEEDQHIRTQTKHTFFSGVPRVVTMPGYTLHVKADSLSVPKLDVLAKPTAANSIMVRTSNLGGLFGQGRGTASVYANVNHLYHHARRLLSTEQTFGVTPSCYRAVVNRLGIDVGQLVGPCVEFEAQNTSSPMATICLSVDDKIPVDLATTPVADIAKLNDRGELVALGAPIAEQAVATEFCSELSLNGLYCPVRRTADYATRTHALESGCDALRDILARVSVARPSEAVDEEEVSGGTTSVTVEESDDSGTLVLVGSIVGAVLVVALLAMFGVLKLRRGGNVDGLTIHNHVGQ